jgi:hypothetical protein
MPEYYLYEPTAASFKILSNPLIILLRRINRLFSFEMTQIAQKMTWPTMVAHVYSLLLELFTCNMALSFFFVYLL